MRPGGFPAPGSQIQRAEKNILHKPASHQPSQPTSSPHNSSTTANLPKVCFGLLLGGQLRVPRFQSIQPSTFRPPSASCSPSTSLFSCLLPILTGLNWSPPASNTAERRRPLSGSCRGVRPEIRSLTFVTYCYHSACHGGSGRLLNLLLSLRPSSSPHIYPLPLDLTYYVLIFFL